MNITDWLAKRLQSKTVRTAPMRSNSSPEHSLSVISDHYALVYAHENCLGKLVAYHTRKQVHIVHLLMVYLLYHYTYNTSVVYVAAQQLPTLLAMCGFTMMGKILYE